MEIEFKTAANEKGLLARQIKEPILESLHSRLEVFVEAMGKAVFLPAQVPPAPEDGVAIHAVADELQHGVFVDALLNLGQRHVVPGKETIQNLS